MIKFINVNKKFNKDSYVLKDINLEIEAGEVVVICGPSGAGKSTLVKTINKLEPIDDGEIIVDGFSIQDPKTNLTSLRAEIGVVFQHLNLYPHKSAIQNIMLAPMKVKKLSKKDAKDRACKLMERVGLMIVTHEIGFACNVADRVVFMDKGEIVEVGRPPDIFVNPQHSRTKEFMSKILHIPVNNGNIDSVNGM
ncbi:MAG: amino acid ABC transporter ATP-binding protein [Nitrospirae bacterium]|nr:amino acid ABC transporter ATP-binding protein [Nitrospirota bacterium]